MKYGNLSIKGKIKKIGRVMAFIFLVVACQLAVLCYYKKDKTA